MNERAPVEVFSPGEYLRDELETRGWTQDVLATIIDCSPRLVNEIITAKRAVTPETAQLLSEALGTSAQMWLNLESAYRLSLVRRQGSLVARRARLYGIGPVKEMIKRGWIANSDSIDVLERRVQDFFELPDLDTQPVPILHAARKSTSYAAVTPSQCAWLFRAKQVAKKLDAEDFTEARLTKCLSRLSGMRREVQQLREVPGVLADAGVRFCVVEQLPQSRIDGAAFWLDAKSPVVALTLRYDRIDWFWYTLMHDLMHIVNRDGRPTAAGHNNGALLEIDLVGRKTVPMTERPASERQADRAARDFLVPSAALNTFVARVRPRYSKTSIIAFAEEIGVHPGIVVGRLQHDDEILYSHSREMLEKVRDIIIGATPTDGWGRTITRLAA